MLIYLDLHVFMLYAMLSMLRSSISFVFYVRSTCFHVSYHVFVPISIFPMYCLARSTCFYARLHIYLSFLHALCFMPCLDPSFLCVDVSIYMLTCQIHMFVCMFYAPMPMSMTSNACMLGFVFFHAFMLTSTCLDVHSHAHMHISMLICVDRCDYMLRSMFSACFIPSSICLCAPCHVYVPRPCLSCHVLLQPFCSFYCMFLCFGLMFRTRSRSYGLCHCPYTKDHIKRFGSPYLHVYACLLQCFMLASLVLGFAMFGALRMQA